MSIAFLFPRLLTQPVCIGRQNTHQLVAESNPHLKKQTVKTTTVRSQGTLAQSLAVASQAGAHLSPLIPQLGNNQQSLFCSAGLHRDSHLWLRRRRHCGTVELCRCQSATNQASGLTLTQSDSAVQPTFCSLVLSVTPISARRQIPFMSPLDKSEF